MRVPTTILASMLVLSSLGFVVFAPTASAGPAITNVRIRSFDNTFLEATVFVPEGATPGSTSFVLMTHGWAGSRTTTATGRVADLLAAGYGVLTWDSRGFGASGGEVELDSPDYEVKDVQAIITWLARFVPEARLDGPLDPHIGMSGGSYAGAIQLLSAAFDSRIDVIAPEIAWNDLTQSLAPNGVPKLGWTTALFGAGQVFSCSDGAAVVGTFNGPTTGCQTNDLARYYAEVHATNAVSDEMRAALEYRSPKNYNANVDIPTLLIQGFPDTLFDVNQAVANYEQIKANGAPVKLWLYDGGHALPGTSVPNTQGANISATVVNWMNRWLKGDTNVDTGAEVQYWLGGAWNSAPSWPVGTAQTRHVFGIPALMQGPVTGGPAASYTQAIANGPLRSAGPAHIAFSVSGTALEARLFLSLGIQDAAGVVTKLDGQTQPVQATFGLGQSARVETDLIAVAANVPAGSRLVLLVGTSDPLFDAERLPGLVNVVNMDVDYTTI